MLAEDGNQRQATLHHIPFSYLDRPANIALAGEDHKPPAANHFYTPAATVSDMQP